MADTVSKGSGLLTHRVFSGYLSLDRRAYVENMLPDCEQAQNTRCGHTEEKRIRFIGRTATNIL